MEINQDLSPIIHEITENQVKKYAESSGDFNPIHLDPIYASTAQFGKRIAPRLLDLVQTATSERKKQYR